MTQEKELELQGTELLRENGYTWAGRLQETVDLCQLAFERRMVLVPIGGQPPRR